MSVESSKTEDMPVTASTSPPVEKKTPLDQLSSPPNTTTAALSSPPESPSTQKNAAHLVSSPRKPDAKNSISSSTGAVRPSPKKNPWTRSISSGGGGGGGAPQGSSSSSGGEVKKGQGSSGGQSTTSSSGSSDAATPVNNKTKDGATKSIKIPRDQQASCVLSCVLLLVLLLCVPCMPCS